MDYAQIIGALLGVVDKVLEAMPDYEQRKREQYFKLRKKLQEEMSRDLPDDNLIGNLTDELKLFLESFSQEISRQKIQAVREERSSEL